MLRLALAAALAALASPAFAEKPRTIVGYWQYPGQACFPGAGAFRIDPLALAVGEEIYCTFESVRRDGPTVTWDGVCSTVESPDQRDTVTATERAGRLTVRFARSGATFEGLRRCTP